MQEVYQKKKEEFSGWSPREIETNNIKLSNKLCCITDFEDGSESHVPDFLMQFLQCLCISDLKVTGSRWARFPHVIPIWPFCLASNPKCTQPTTILGRCTVSHKYLHVTLALTYSSHLVLANTIHCIFVPNAFWRAVPWNKIIKFRKTLCLMQNAVEIKSQKVPVQHPGSASRRLWVTWRRQGKNTKTKIQNFLFQTEVFDVINSTNVCV